MVKGMLQTLEASLGAVALLSVLLLINQPQETESISLSRITYECLQDLVQDGNLFYYSENLLEANLKTSLQTCIPATADIAVRICMTAVCTTTVPGDRDVFSVSYLVAGSTNYNPSIVNVWVWLK